MVWQAGVLSLSHLCDALYITRARSCMSYLTLWGKITNVLHDGAWPVDPDVTACGACGHITGHMPGGSLPRFSVLIESL